MVKLKCYHCGGDRLARNGLTQNGKQRYLCSDCGRMSRDDPQANGYTEEEREHIPRAYHERSSLRGLSRTFGVSRHTVTSWLKKEATLPELSETLIDPTLPATIALELDELWSFVLKRANKRWIWIALCRATRQVVAYVVGDRSRATCQTLWERIPAKYRAVHCYSDFWEAYSLVIPAEQHTAAGKESGFTAHVERWNNTLRQRLGRFVRKSLSFSKSDAMHELCLRLLLHDYNNSLALSYD
jgi:IS1 family transposase